jgi:hypothetical protein
MEARFSKSTVIFALASAGIITLAGGCGTIQNENPTGTPLANNESSNIGVILPNGEVGFATGSEESTSLGLSVGGATCKIELPFCANGKVAAKIINESAATTYGSFLPLLQLGQTYQAEACRLRAVQYAQYCQNAPGQIAKSSYVSPNGQIIKEKIGDNGKVARVSIVGFCAPLGNANTIDAEDTWGEAFGDPEHDLAQAEQRFKDHVAWCKATPTSTLIIYKVIQSGKVVFQKSNR